MYCDGIAPIRERRRFVQGPAGRRFTGFEAEVRVRLEGTGALAGLSQSYSKKVYCPACLDAGSPGSIYVRVPQGRLDDRQRPRLEVRLGAKWYDCVRSTSTLELRLFKGDSRNEALNTLRPYAVLMGLERQILAGRPKVAKDDRLAFEVPIDAATICRRGSGWVAYELWGQGELHRAGGGGRGAVRVDCP